MIVERYPYDGAGAVDITRYCLMVDWQDSTTAPYHTISLTIESGFNVRPVNYGDQIVVRPGAGLPAVALGWPTDIATDVSMQANGVAYTGVWQVSCIGWYDYLCRADLVLAVGLKDRNSLGTLFGTGEDPYEGLSTIQQELARFAAENPDARNIRGVAEAETDGLAAVFTAYLSVVNGVGPALDAFIRRIARINLAPGLCGTSHGTDASGNPTQIPVTDMRGSVRVAYDDATVQALCGSGIADRAGRPARTCEPIMGVTPNFQALFNGSSKVGGVIQGTWGADSLLVEMFPTLEDPGPGSTPPPRPLSPAERLEQAKLTVPNLVTGEPAPFEPGSFSPDYQTTVSNGLIPGAAQTLGRNPVLLYRICPWRVTPLLDWMARLEGIDPGFGRLRKGVEQGVLATSSYQRVTWNLARGAVVEGEFTSIRLQSTDADNETVFVPQWNGGESQLSYWERSGFPFLDVQAARLGARVHVVSWPFFRGSEGLPPEIRASVESQAQTVVSQAAQFGVGMGRFARGTIGLPLRLDIRHGEPLTVRFSRGELTCYVQAVRHTVQITPEGAIKTKTTTVTFSRGLWDESLRDFPAPPFRQEPVQGRVGPRGIDAGSRP